MVLADFLSLPSLRPSRLLATCLLGRLVTLRSRGIGRSFGLSFIFRLFPILSVLPTTLGALSRRVYTPPPCSVRFGSVRFGSVRFGSVRFGSVRFGSVRFGSVRFSGWVGSVVQLGVICSARLACTLPDPARFVPFCFPQEKPCGTLAAGYPRILRPTNDVAPTASPAPPPLSETESCLS